MKKFSKTIAILVLISFGLSNVSYASGFDSFKLSPPSSFSTLKSQEFKEAAQIQIGVRMALKGLPSMDLSSLNAIGKRQFVEKTVFTRKVSGTIYFNEALIYSPNSQKASTETGSYLVKAETARGAIYSCIISNDSTGNGYNISVVPKVLPVKKESVFKKIVTLSVLATFLTVLPAWDRSGNTQDSIVQRETVQRSSQAYQFANKYSVDRIVRDQKEAEAFIWEYIKWESGFYKSVRIKGIAMDGWDLKEDTLEPVQIRDWTAASKESLDIAIQVKILTGNKYGVRLTGNTDANLARHEAVKILKEKIDSYERYRKLFPAFGGFLPWITIKDTLIKPTSDWKDRLPALDNGEWAWSLYTAYHTLKRAGEDDLAKRYKNYFDVLVKSAPVIFYDTKLRKIRAEAKIKDPETKSVEKGNYSNNIAGYYLDDPYEGMMMVYLLILFTNLPQSEKDHIWDDIKMEKITTDWGTTYKGWPPQAPLDGSPHIKWAFMFLPITDDAIAKKVYGLQEKIRSNINKYGIPVSTNTPGAIGYTAYAPNIFGIYGPFSMIYYHAIQGDVTKNNYGLAWLLNILQADKMQGPLGSGESFSVKPGTNQLEDISTVLTVDGKMTLWLAIMGGIMDETRTALKADGLYDDFMRRTSRQYAATFGNISSVIDNAEFQLPRKPIAGKYIPKTHEKTSEMIDLSAIWQYPALDKWGDKTRVKIEGKKIVIEHRPGIEGGWGWAGGALKIGLTPAKGSAIYLKGKGIFKLKLEGKNKKAVIINVILNGEKTWTKVPLDDAYGQTFYVMIIDEIMQDVTIAERFYSPDGRSPDNKEPVKINRDIADAEDLRAEKKTMPDIQTMESKDRVANLMAGYKLSASSHWGAAIVKKIGNKLVVQHNGSVDGSGWSWTGESLKPSYTLKPGEGIRVTGKGNFKLKLEGSETLMRDVDLNTARSITINDLPPGLLIERIVIDQIMPGVTIEIDSIEIVNMKKSALEIAPAMLAAALAMPLVVKRDSPGDDDIRLIVSRIKESGAEIFLPKSQFPGNTINRYKGVVESIGGKLRVYQNVEDLRVMIKNPAKSIVMTVDAADEDMELLRELKTTAGAVRFMNFAKMEDLDKMASEELDNYEAEILGILLIARVISSEDLQDKGSPTYRMLSYLLEDYMPDGASVEDYIADIVTNAVRLIKTVLKALPVTAYKLMRQPVEVLWSA